MAEIEHNESTGGTFASMGEVNYKENAGGLVDKGMVRLAYSEDVKALNDLTVKAIKAQDTDRDPNALHTFAKELAQRLGVPTPENAVFNRISRKGNEVQVNYYFDANPTSTDLTQRGHQSATFSFHVEE